MIGDLAELRLAATKDPFAKQLCTAFHYACRWMHHRIDVVLMLQLSQHYKEAGELWLANMARVLADIGVLGLPKTADQILDSIRKSRPRRRRKFRG